MINVHEIGTNIDGNRDQNPPEAKNIHKESLLNGFVVSNGAHAVGTTALRNWPPFSLVISPQFNHFLSFPHRLSTSSTHKLQFRFQNPHFRIYNRPFRTV